GRGTKHLCRRLTRCPSPLIKPDVPISSIRLSDRLHLAGCGKTATTAIISGIPRFRRGKEVEGMRCSLRSGARLSYYIARQFRLDWGILADPDVHRRMSLPETAQRAPELRDRSRTTRDRLCRVPERPSV